MVEQRVVKLRDRAHGDPGEGYGTPFCEDPERLQDQPADRCEYHRAVELARGTVFCPTRPVGAQLSRKGTMLFAPGEDVDLASPVDRDLDSDVR